jgi:hypothetical protein
MKVYSEAEAALIRAVRRRLKGGVNMDKTECCNVCRWYEPFNGVCCNGESENRADFMEADGSCEDWEELPPEPACICKCVANWGGHCVVPNCRGPITEVDLPSPASDEEAAKRYDLFADFFEEMFENA